VETARDRTGIERPLQVLVLLLVAALAYVLSPVTASILLGGFIALVGNGPYEWLVRRLRGRRAAAAWIATLVVIAMIFTPVGLLVYKTAAEASAGIQWLIPRLQSLGTSGLISHVPASLRALVPTDVTTELARLGTRAAAYTPELVSDLGRWVAEAFLAAVTMFYLFSQGPAFVSFVRRVSPLRPDHTEVLLHESAEVGRGLFWGNLMAAVAHGVAGAIGYLIVGVPQVVFLGALTFVASFIPAIGTAAIWIPIAVILWFTGSHWPALVLLAWGVVVIGGIDNVLRPLLSRGSARVPNLLMFLTLFGGLAIFGLKGILIGPLIAGLALAALRIVAQPTA
jgi:predicted PurR-regulated permease PerM